MKTRVFVLPHSEYRMILSSFVWIQYRRTTDKRTERRKYPGYNSAERSALQAMRTRCKNGIYITIENILLELENDTIELGLY